MAGAALIFMLLSIFYYEYVDSSSFEEEKDDEEEKGKWKALYSHLILVIKGTTLNFNWDLNLNIKLFGMNQLII